GWLIKVTSTVASATVTSCSQEHAEFGGLRGPLPFPSPTERCRLAKFVLRRRCLQRCACCLGSNLEFNNLDLLCARFPVASLRLFIASKMAVGTVLVTG